MKIERVLEWLDHAGPDLTLVGGQAVALWEHLLGLPILTETVDIDFLGDAAQALELAAALACRWSSACASSGNGWRDCSNAWRAPVLRVSKTRRRSEWPASRTTLGSIGT